MPKKRHTIKRKRLSARLLGKQVKQAIKLYQKFREANPRHIDTVKIPSFPKVMLQIGRVDGVLYTTTHNGKTIKYVHKFSGRSKPILATDAKGKQLYFLGGHYNFTSEGIVDKRP